MIPVLLNIGNFTVTSFGLSIVTSFIVGLYIIWRLAIVYDLDKEKVIDLFLITTFASIIGARVLFTIEHPTNFQNLSQVLFINRYPGFNFWGGLIFAVITLIVTYRRFKLSFWQLADMAVVGLLIGLAITSVGCLFASCQYGYPSKLPLAVVQNGVVDKRFPIQIVAAVIYFFAFSRLWRSSLKFHLVGSIAAKSLIWIGVINVFIDFFRDDIEKSFFIFSTHQIYGFAAALIGTIYFYRLSKRSIIKDLRFIPRILTDPKVHKKFVALFTDTWYNFLNIFSHTKRILKKINVKPTPKKF